MRNGNSTEHRRGGENSIERSKTPFLFTPAVGQKERGGWRRGLGGAGDGQEGKMSLVIGDDETHN